MDSAIQNICLGLTLKKKNVDTFLELNFSKFSILMNEVPCKQKYKTQQNGYTEPSMHNQIA
jgi:hypothetical protein